MDAEIAELLNKYNFAVNFHTMPNTGGMNEQENRDVMYFLFIQGEVDRFSERKRKISEMDSRGSRNNILRQVLEKRSKEIEKANEKKG